MRKSLPASLSIIAAMDAARGIGINNALPWKLKEDLAHFKQTTMGSPIIMGRKTFESLGKPLPGRRNIVITRDKDAKFEGAEVASSIAGACLQAGANGESSAFVIGGSIVYHQALAFVDRLVLTEISDIYECDAFFPPIDKSVWIEESREEHVNEDGLKYAFVNYVRKS